MIYENGDNIRVHENICGSIVYLDDYCKTFHSMTYEELKNATRKGNGECNFDFMNHIKEEFYNYCSVNDYDGQDC